MGALRRLSHSATVRAGLAAFLCGLFGGALSSGVFGFEYFAPGLRYEKSDGYFELADGLRQGWGLRFERDGPLVSHRPPVYTLLVLPLAALPERVAFPLYIVMQSLLLGGSGAITYRLAARLAGPRVATAAVALLLVNPALLLSIPNVAPWYWEMFLYALICWQLAVLVERLDRPAPRSLTLRGGLLLGVLLGMLCLTHGSKLLTVVLLLPAVGLWAWWQRKPQLLPALGVSLAVAVLMIAPWSYRNWLALGKFVPISTNAGLAYFVGNANWGLGEGRFEEDWVKTGLRYAGIPGSVRARVTHWSLDDPQWEERASQRMKEHMRRHPGQLAAKVGLNALEQYFPVSRFVYLKGRGLIDTPWRQLVLRSGFKKAALMSAFHLVILSAAAVGLYRAWKQGDGQGLPWLYLAAILCFSLPYYPFLVRALMANYTFPLMPLWSSLAALALASRFAQRSGRAPLLAPRIGGAR